MIPIHVDPTWPSTFPGARMGLLEARGLPPLVKHASLEDARCELQKELADLHRGKDRSALRELPVMRAFGAHFKPFGKTYHVLSQLESVALKGRPIPSMLCSVTALFMAELKFGLVAAGHDLSIVNQPLTLAASRGGESYTGFKGALIVLPTGDMTLHDARGVLSSVLYGPEDSSPVRSSTTDVLYTIYAPASCPAGCLEGEIEALASYVRLFAPEARLEKKILPETSSGCALEPPPAAILQTTQL